MDLAQALFSRDAAIDPYPLLAQLRAEAAVHRVHRFGWWVVTRYEDVTKVLKRHDLFSSDTGLDRMRPRHIDERTWRGIEALRGRNLINTDPPAHTRLRKVISAAFTPRAMARLEGRVQQIARDLVDDIVACDTFDVVADLAVPLPVRVIAEMLGVDPARGADFKRWSDDLLELGRLTRERGGTPEQNDRLVRSRRELLDHLQATITARREDPRDDLLSELARAEAEDGALTPEDVLSMAILLLVAGNETTTNLIATGTHLLLAHPDAFAAVRAELERIPAFVEEVLRYEGPVMMLFRRTMAEVTLSGITIPAGELVLPLVAAANRDPSQFPDPDRFDVRRDARGHLGFGHGIHFCVGAPLSRLEGRIAFGELLRRAPAFSRVDPQPEWGDTTSIRGLRRLRVRFHHGSRTTGLVTPMSAARALAE